MSQVTQKKIKKIAIANRGEVAVRIIQACNELGIQTVLLHSEPDVQSRAYRMANESVCIGPASSALSYLNIKNNIQAALSVGADAIHPGFGFLSENADFAQACLDAGIEFIGPSPKAIRLLGDKISAKNNMIAANVPVVPGYQGEKQDLQHLEKEALKIGFPLIIKAAAGGGGRGMKLVREAKDLASQLQSAQSEALAGFGSPVVFLEKYIENPKHIEFQIFGDKFGNVVHLFDRECSVQRRHQKIIEEACSASLSESLRNKMADAAVAAAKSANYYGAGTVEFLLSGDQFYFLEINTRLQVEHTVTEMVLGVDLVKAQIQIAMGQKLAWQQKDLKVKGHAIECRLYAEDSYKSSVPSTGKLLACHWPHGPGRRFDYGFDAGDEITSYYDPMIAKIIVYDESRESCRQKLLHVISEILIFGVKTNLAYLREIVSHPEFVDSTMTTAFIAKYFPNALEKSEEELFPKEQIQALQSKMSSTMHAASALATNVMQSPFETKHWRNV